MNNSVNRMGDVPRNPWVRIEDTPHKEPSWLSIIIPAVILGLVLLGTIKLTEWEVRREERAKAINKGMVALMRGEQVGEWLFVPTGRIRTYRVTRAGE